MKAAQAVSAAREWNPFPEKPRFSGHETFPFRYAWMAKTVNGLKADPEIFVKGTNYENGMQEFGVGTNMVRSMEHWALALELIKREPTSRTAYIPTALGDRFFSTEGWDPYLEDMNTIWWMHWQLVRNQRMSTTWWWAFNAFGARTFTREHLQHALSEELTKHKMVIPKSLKRDTDVFIRSYVELMKPGEIKDDTLECPLTELRLIRSVKDVDGGRQRYQFVEEGHESLSDELFAYVVALYIRDRYGVEVKENGGSTVTVTDLLYADRSPGRIYRLSDSAFIQRLEAMSAIPGIEYDETAGLQQIFITDPKALTEIKAEQ